MTLTNGNGQLDQRIKNKRSRKSGKAPQKTFQSTSDAIDVAINNLSRKMNEEKDDAKCFEMFENSADNVYNWIKALLLMKELERGVVSHFVAKFPQIKENVALIHQIYLIHTKKLKSTIYDLSTKFRELVPAI
uniref:Uncharacterized protein n=1 Tax=Panagrolaimus sp. ES5 TaxID=591445 RepID=A0AC34GLP9_9BILA